MGRVKDREGDVTMEVEAGEISSEDGGGPQAKEYKLSLESG